MALLQTAKKTAEITEDTLTILRQDVYKRQTLHYAEWRAVKSPAPQIKDYKR